MALTQIQIIQSLAEAMNWLDRELSWGVAIQEQRHLIGRISELYAAVMTGGQMAPEINQAGYDVVSSSGERISVKTTTQQAGSGHISFTNSTLDKVDRVMIFYLNTDEMQIDTLLDASIKKVIPLLTKSNNKRNITLSKLRKLSAKTRDLADQKMVREVKYDYYTIREYESGTILIYKNNVVENITKPILRQISKELGIPITNSSGNEMNTRQLGSRIIRELQS